MFQGKRDMRMFVDAPDDAFVLMRKTNAVKEICQFCEGTGGVAIKGRGFTCPGCNGLGGKTRYFSDWELANAKLLSVTMAADLSPVRYVYNVSQTTVYDKEAFCRVEFGAEDVFSEKEAAENELSRRRNAGISSEEGRRCLYE